MIKAFEKQNPVACMAPYVECVVEGKSFFARVDTGGDISVIPNNVMPTEVRFKNPITTRDYQGNIDRVWAKDIEITIPELGTFRPEKCVITTNAAQGLIGMDILNQCGLQMIWWGFLYLNY